MVIKDKTDAVTEAHSKISGFKRRDVVAAQKVLASLEEQNIDVVVAQDKLDEYIDVRDSTAADYGGKDEYAEAKDSAWEEFLTAVEDIDASEVEDEDEDEPAEAEGTDEEGVEVPEVPEATEESSNKTKKKGQTVKAKLPGANKPVWRVTCTDGYTKDYASGEEGAAKYRAYRIAHDSGRKVEKVELVSSPSTTESSPSLPDEAA